MQKFSVLTSVYKNDNPKFVEEALLSIINNSVKPDEIVMTIDGPVSDEIHKVLDAFAKKHSELKLIQLEKNRGLGLALREGLSHCKNELVARMDSDDICDSKRFEKQLRFMEENNFDISGGFISEFIESPDKPISTREVPLTQAEISKRIKLRNPFNHVTVIFKKSKVEAAGSYQDMHYVEDYFLWCRMHLAGCSMGNMSDVLTYVRVGEDVYLRRGGLKYFKSQKKLFKFMYEKKIISLFEYIKTLAIRFTVQVLMPNRLRAKIYTRHLRKK